MQETKNYLLTFTAVAFLLVLSASISNYRGAVGGATVSGPLPLETVSASLPVAINRKTPVPKGGATREPKLLAKAILVQDRESGTVLLERNLAAVLPIASLTKLLSALVVQKSGHPWDETVEIKPPDVTGIPPYRAGFVVSEQLRLGDLLTAMLVASANDAALALARHVGGTVENFVQEMNREATALGMKDTHFENPVGFDDLNQFSTAGDLSLLVDEFLSHPELVGVGSVKATEITSLDGKYHHRLVSTNKLMLSNPEVVGLKTGYTDEARGNLILLVDDDPARYYVIILGSDDRELDGERVLRWVKENFIWQ